MYTSHYSSNLIQRAKLVTEMAVKENFLKFGVM